MRTIHRVILAGILLVSLLAAQTSAPVTPPQPNQLLYGPSELALFKSFTRDSYERTFGVQAPAYDPARPMKTWFDSTVDVSDPDAFAVYKYLGTTKDGPALKQFVLSAKDAARVNLPGRIRYAPYVVAPTKAVVRGMLDSAQDALLNPDYLSLKSQAEQLRAEIGDPSLPITEGNLTGPFSYYYPPEEPRRMWNLGGMNVGLLIKTKNRDGVGYPGKWFKTPTGEYAWQSDPLAPDGSDDTRPAVAMPLRDLLPNERLQASPFGVQIWRMDKQAEKDKADGKFTDEDRELLRRILSILEKSK